MKEIVDKLKTAITSLEEAEINLYSAIRCVNTNFLIDPYNYSINKQVEKIQDLKNLRKSVSECCRDLADLIDDIVYDNDEES